MEDPVPVPVPVAFAASSKRPVLPDRLLGVVVVLLLASVAFPGIRAQPEHAIDVPSVARLSKLVRLARDEAVATGDAHILFLEPANADGEGARVVLFRDLDGNAEPGEVEMMGRYPIAPAHWGSKVAATRAIGDAGDWMRGPWSFGARALPAAIPEAAPEPMASLEATPERDATAAVWAGPSVHVRGIAFDASGVPHRVVEASGFHTDPGSGAASLYLNTAERDYAVVLSPWGDIEVQSWDPETAGWQMAFVP